MKLYAVLFGNGAHLIKRAEWKEIKPMVNHVKGTMVKSFENREDAEKWVRTNRGRSITRAVIGGSGMIPKRDLMAKNINTPYWKKHAARIIAGRKELDAGFNQHMLKDGG